ncbi:MAG: DUF4038 domain-containing protein [Eubacteriales bacterium]|nr:DUF4038 domain-containing protein [Eubacteriales bacterium]
MEEHTKSAMHLSVKQGSSYFWNGEKVFFWMGDTAWLLFHNLTREEIDLYLRNRAEKGINVIQAVAVHHLPAKNVYGSPAFQDGDMKKPAEDGENSYWTVIDWAVERARELGLYIAMVPHWGELSKKIAMEDMEAYVRFLSERYGKKENILWMMGGDVRGDESEEYWQTMGKIFREMCPEKLITFHPFGRTSSLDFFKGASWMDFHTFQSGHRRYDQQSLYSWDDTVTERYYGEDNWRYVQDGREQAPHMPILDAEPSYEHIPQGLHLEHEPYWTPEQVRRYGWWSVLAGAAGFTYGHNSIMQFYTGEGPSSFFAKYPWKDSLHAPALGAVTHMAHFMQGVFDEVTDEAVRLGEDPAQYVEKVCKPCEDILEGDCAWNEAQKEDRILAFAAGNTILCYTYTGRPVTVKLEKDGEAWWLDPENGVKSYLGKTVKGTGTFTPPVGDFQHSDWLLIVKVS